MKPITILLVIMGVSGFVLSIADVSLRNGTPVFLDVALATLGIVGLFTAYLSAMEE